MENDMKMTKISSTESSFIDSLWNRIQIQWNFIIYKEVGYINKTLL